jgi:hypothetical protein
MNDITAARLYGVAVVGLIGLGLRSCVLYWRSTVGDGTSQRTIWWSTWRVLLVLAVLILAPIIVLTLLAIFTGGWVLG